MTEILPIADPHEQEALAARCNLPFFQNSTAYAALQNGTVVAICQFTRSEHHPKAQIQTIGSIPLPEKQKAEILHLLEIAVQSYCMQTYIARKSNRSTR